MTILFTCVTVAEKFACVTILFTCVTVAEKFDCVTILFGDIVTFTNIAAACTPMDVVNMLNELYHRFDTRSNVRGVYKVGHRAASVSRRYQPC